MTRIAAHSFAFGAPAARVPAIARSLAWILERLRMLERALGRTFGLDVRVEPGMDSEVFAVLSPVSSAAVESGRAERATHAPARARRDDGHRGPPHVIIGGYGPVGRALADALGRIGVPITIIDSNEATARTQARLGVRVITGSVTDPAALHAAGIERAAAIAITIPDGEDAVRATELARHLAPGVIIAVRTSFMSQGLGAIRAGANSVTVEEVATAHAMADAVASYFRAPGVPAEGAD